VGDIPVVICLPAQPKKVHVSAEIGGDSIWGRMDHPKPKPAIDRPRP
jgi:hypothetical protein